MLLIHWNFSIPHTGGELADPYYGWLHILQGCYYLLNPFSWKGGTRLYQTLVCCFQITWNGFIKVEKVNFVDVQNLWSIHIESIWIKSVLEVSNIWSRNLRPSRGIDLSIDIIIWFIENIELFDIFYVNVLSSTDEPVRRRSPYSKLSETSRHCLMFTQTLSFLTNNVSLLLWHQKVYYVIKIVIF